MSQSIETQNRLAHYRAKAQANELTLDEMRDAIRIMREDRNSHSASPSKAKAKSAKGPTKSADDLLAELDGI